MNVVIDGVEYTPVVGKVTNTEGLPFCIIRCFSAGVHCGFLKEKNGDEVVLVNARRIWKWAGAAELNQLSQQGVKRPKECRISVTVPETTIKGWIEIVPTSEKAKKSIDGVAEWEEG
jgi:hypothetical protein